MIRVLAMGKTEKRFNKRLIWLVIGSAVIWGLSMTPKGKSFWKRTIDRVKRPFKFMRAGVREMRKTMKTKNEK